MMKIIGFTQLRNELSNGNLEYWFHSMSQCDLIYIYDQASDDGSQDVYKQHDNVVLYQSNTNRFFEQQWCWEEMTKDIQKAHGPDDWVFWLDGDTIIPRWFDAHKTIAKALEHGSDSVGLGHKNLWRSHTWYRVDSKFDWLDGKRVALWQNTDKLHYKPKKGPHAGVTPLGIRRTMKRKDIPLIHLGFATDEAIITKYRNYEQGGFPSPRIVDETGLTVERLDPITYPDWFGEIDEVNPKNKPPLKEIMENEH